MSDYREIAAAIVALSPEDKRQLLVDIILELTICARAEYENLPGPFQKIIDINEGINRICGYLDLIFSDGKLPEESHLAEMVVYVLKAHGSRKFRAMLTALTMGGSN